MRKLQDDYTEFSFGAFDSIGLIFLAKDLHYRENLKLGFEASCKGCLLYAIF